MDRIRQFLSAVLRLDTALLLLVVGAATLLNLGFIFGKTCTGVYFWAVLCVLIMATAWVSRRLAWHYLLAVAILLIVSAYTFTYLSSDSQRCHAVLQRFLVSGWNPILQNTPERIRDIVCFDFGGVSFEHMLYLPKITAYVGALVASAMGVWLGDAFLGNLLAIVLVLTSLRFCKLQWSVSSWRAWLFAAVSLAPTFYISVFTGQAVDYVVYASMVILVLSFANWWRERQMADLAVVNLSGVVAFAAKANAYGLVIVLFLSLLVVCGRDRRIRRGLLLSFLTLLLLMASPLLTSWITCGSPFYPSHTFDATRPIGNLCADMTGNEDALQMGYLARVVYAWCSKRCAVAGCAWWYDKPDFNPVFTVAVDGRGATFTLLLCASVAALALSRRNCTWYAWGVIALSCIALPRTFIGYPRYVPQVWMLPVLALFNLAFTRFSSSWTRWLPVVIPVAYGLYVAPFYLRTGLHYMRSLTLERLRQERLSVLSKKGGEYRLDGGTGYWIYHVRAALGDVKISNRDNDVPLQVDEEYFLYSSDKLAMPALPVGTFPQFNSPRDFLANPWKEYLKTLRHPPKPLFGDF